jgi:hypothetical protein
VQKERTRNNFLQNESDSMQREDSGHQSEPIKQFFRERLNVEPKEENKAYITFIIPREKEEQLTDFFAEMQDREEELGISDIQLSLATLEEIFLKIARQAEVETAAADGSFTTLNLPSGTLIQVPTGARFVVIPGTESEENPGGLMVEVQWDQDDTGVLCISGHSNEIPVPPHLVDTERVTPISRNRSSRSVRRSFSSNVAPIGLVIEEDKISASNRST